MLDQLLKKLIKKVKHEIRIVESEVKHQEGLDEIEKEIRLLRKELKKRGMLTK